MLLTFLLCSAVFLLVFSWDCLFDSVVKGTIPPLYEEMKKCATDVPAVFCSISASVFVRLSL